MEKGYAKVELNQARHHMELLHWSLHFTSAFLEDMFVNASLRLKKRPGEVHSMRGCVCFQKISSQRRRTLSLFSLRPNEGMWGGMEGRRTQQLAVTRVSEKQAGLCADVQMTRTNCFSTPLPNKSPWHHTQAWQGWSGSHHLTVEAPAKAAELTVKWQHFFYLTIIKNKKSRCLLPEVCRQM